MKIKEITLKETYKVTKSDTQQGLELTAQDGTKMIIPPEKMAAIQSNPQEPNKFTLNPLAVSTPDPAQQQQQQQQLAPKIGSEVNIPTDSDVQTDESMDDADYIASGHNHDIGGDPTDKLIYQVTDHEFNNARSSRHHNHRPEIAESAELIDMLTIAGLR